MRSIGISRLPAELGGFGIEEREHLCWRRCRGEVLHDIQPMPATIEAIPIGGFELNGYPHCTWWKHREDWIGAQLMKPEVSAADEAGSFPDHRCLALVIAHTHPG